jgi:hypothetical protein
MGQRSLGRVRIWRPRMHEPPRRCQSLSPRTGPVGWTPMERICQTSERFFLRATIRTDATYRGSRDGQDRIPEEAGRAILHGHLSAYGKNISRIPDTGPPPLPRSPPRSSDCIHKGPVLGRSSGEGKQLLSDKISSTGLCLPNYKTPLCSY